VATSLETRVKQLEGGTGGRCPECGFDGVWSKVKLRYEGFGKGKSERCNTCGRLTRIVLRWEEKV
jgi:DNA-directed RNA polymerase subunit RPC12/RpoP